jgi:hypothetical protein
MKPSFLAFIIEYDEKLNQKGSEGILTPFGASIWVSSGNHVSY